MPVWYQEGKILSCADAIAKAIEWHLQGKAKVKVEGSRNDPVLQASTKEENGLLLPVKQVSINESIQLFLRGACPECGGPLLFEEGCAKCLCGYSDCG
jgi:ribonucleoside-diphosphate reductase alpha chain